jgi:hypothetical protein
VVAALPPRAGLAAALELASAGRVGVLQAPLHGGLADEALPEGARDVQVAHGWVNLPGRAWATRMLAEVPWRQVTLRVRGLPEGPGEDLDEILLQGLALARRLLPGATIARAKQEEASRVEVTLGGKNPLKFSLLARRGEPELDLRMEGDKVGAAWRVDTGKETLESRRGARVQQQERPVAPAVERALWQLLQPELGDALVDAKEAARLLREVHGALGRRAVPGAEALRLSARRAEQRPDDPLAPLGFEGALPTAAPVEEFQAPTPPEPLEFWLFRAGLKPVVFLTVPPEEADATAALFAGATVERRARRVQVGPQDAWVDRRDAGEDRVELYISKNPKMAAEAARLQSEGDPSRNMELLGMLLGYPPCCVRAFREQTNRSNNTQNRHATAGRTASAGPWPWELNNLHTMLIPCYPCRYDCPEALALARAALAAMDEAHPGTSAALRALLARPVLYFDDARQLTLDGEITGEEARYRGVSVPSRAPEPFRRFAGAVAGGDALALTDRTLRVTRGGDEVLSLRRTDPGLGLLVSFR